VINVSITTVRKHQRKKPTGGRTTVKRHSRSISESKTVPSERSVYDEDEELQKLLSEKEELKAEARKIVSKIKATKKEFDDERDESKWDEILDRKSDLDDKLFYIQSDLKRNKDKIGIRHLYIKEAIDNINTRKGWLKRRGPLSGTNNWGLKSPQIASRVISDRYILAKNKYRNMSVNPRNFNQFHASGSRQFRGGNTIMLSEVGRMTAYGRGSGHFGTGVYTFDTLKQANAYQRSPDGEVTAFMMNENTYNPFVTKDFEQGINLHDFGKELNELRYSDLDKRYFPHADLKNYASKADLTYKPDLARHAVDMSVRDDSFHPMTYYMSALGYDGVFHDQEMARSSTYGNVIYPHKIKEIYPNTNIKETF